MIESKVCKLAGFESVKGKGEYFTYWFCGPASKDVFAWKSGCISRTVSLSWDLGSLEVCTSGSQCTEVINYK